VVTTCMFCGSDVSFRMKLLHDRYCSAEHKQAYFEAMDRLGLERLSQAQPCTKSYEPCTKPVDLGPGTPEQAAVSAVPPKSPKFEKRPRPSLELAQGEAAAVAGV
jgi:hypothetical protein